MPADTQSGAGVRFVPRPECPDGAERAEQLRALREASLTNLELSDMLSGVTRQVAEFTGAEAGSIRVVDGDELTAGHCWGYDRPDLREHPIRVDAFLRPLVDESLCLVADDVWADDRVPDRRRARLESEGLRATASLPIIRGGDTVGILTVYRDHVHSWSVKHLAELAAVTESLADGLANAWHHEQDHARQRFLSTLTAHAPQPVLGVDGEARIRYANEVAADLLRLRGSKLEGMGLLDLIECPDDTSRWVRHLLDSLRNGRAVRAWEGRLRAGHAGSVPVRLKAVPVPPADAPVRAMISLEDLREEHAMLVELGRDSRLAATQQFVAGVSHDINNAMTPILGSAQLAMQKSTDPAIAGFLSVIEHEALRASETVKRLQKLTTPLAADQRVELLDPNDVVREHVSRSNERQEGSWAPEQRPARILTALRGTGKCWCVAEELAEVLRQLVLNAAEATVGSPSVSIETDSDEEEFRITVSDHGVGMTEAQRHRAFDPYYTTKTSRGSGLGLSLCRNLLTRHNGSLTLSPNDPQGTRATVVLPLSCIRAEGAQRKSNQRPLFEVIVLTSSQVVYRLVSEVAGTMGGRAHLGNADPLAGSDPAGARNLVYVLDCDRDDGVGRSRRGPERVSMPEHCLGSIALGVPGRQQHESTEADVVLTKPFRASAMQEAIASLVYP